MATAKNNMIAYGVTRSEIMRRAWQLARLNRRTASEKIAARFSVWLRHAWEEARTGNTQFWQPLPLVEQLRQSLMLHDAKPRWSKADYGTRSELAAQIAAAQA